MEKSIPVQCRSCGFRYSREFTEDVSLPDIFECERCEEQTWHDESHSPL